MGARHQEVRKHLSLSWLVGQSTVTLALLYQNYEKLECTNYERTHLVYALSQPVNVYKFMNDTFVNVITTTAKETKPSGRRTPSEM